MTTLDYNWVTGESGASAGGAILAYTTGKFSFSRLTWLDSAGRPGVLLFPPGAYFDPRLSPDSRSRSKKMTGVVDPATSGPSTFRVPCSSVSHIGAAFRVDGNFGPQMADGWRSRPTRGRPHDLCAQRERYA